MQRKVLVKVVANTRNSAMLHGLGLVVKTTNVNVRLILMEFPMSKRELMTVLYASYYLEKVVIQCRNVHFQNMMMTYWQCPFHNFGIQQWLIQMIMMYVTGTEYFT